MRTRVLAGGVCAVLLTTSPSFAMTNGECAAEWKKIDSKRTGSVSETKARRYYASKGVANTPDADGPLTQDAFTEQCRAGLFIVSAP